MAYTLELSGLEIDERLALAGTFSHKNLLHNGDFRNPVNQRGTVDTYYSEGYGIDGWYTEAGAQMMVDTTNKVLTVKTSGTQYGRLRTKMLTQLSDGDKLTFSVDVESYDGSDWYIEIVARNPDDTSDVYLGNTSIIGTGITSTTVMFSAIDHNLTDFMLNIANSGITSDQTISLYRAKLEYGSVSTLANDPPANYGERLRKCQEQYWDSGYCSSDPQVGACSGIALSTSVLLTNIKFPVSMHDVPTILIYGTSGNTANTMRGILGGTAVLTSPSFRASRDGIVLVVDSGTPFTVGSAYDFRVVASDEL